ncbi:hypothetical protein KAU45_03600 [bacterium]|nr:hypothetical protein [bacterium]
MTRADFDARVLGTAALAAALLGFIVAANYLVPVFFTVYLEPWFWPTLAALVTLLAFIRLLGLARRGGEGEPLRAALKGMVFLGPQRSSLPAVVWTVWLATLVVSFRGLGTLSVWPGAALSLETEALKRVVQIRLILPFILWPILSLGLGIAALLTALRRRRFLVLAVAAVVVSLFFIAGDILLRSVASRVNESSEEMIEEEIQRMIEEAKAQ